MKIKKINGRKKMTGKDKSKILDLLEKHFVFQFCITLLILNFDAIFHTLIIIQMKILVIIIMEKLEKKWREYLGLD